MRSSASSAMPADVSTDPSGDEESISTFRISIES